MSAILEDSFWPKHIMHDLAHMVRTQFSDCTETSLRNFFNLLAYDPTTQTFKRIFLNNWDVTKML